MKPSKKMDELDQIKQNYFRGEATDAELEELLRWMKQSPENREALFGEKDVWDSYALLADSHKYSVDSEWKRFAKSIQPQTKTKQKTLFPTWIRIAAAVVLSLGIGWLIRGQFENTPTKPELATTKEVVVPKGQLVQLFLADGTHIWVNAESTVKVPSVFSGKFREVSLEGEAFFEVAKDKEHPFRVNVDGQTVEVLGTSFNVRAYPSSDIIQTTLNEGKIKLTTEHKEITLAPGEQTELSRTTGIVTVKKVKPNFYDSWKEGRYEFVDENLIDVFKLVERWYDVEISYNPQEFKDMFFSGVIRKNKPVTHFLNMLDHSIPINYEQKEDKITIRKK